MIDEEPYIIESTPTESEEVQTNDSRFPVKAQLLLIGGLLEKTL